MINDMKLGFKMLRYSHGIKGNVACAVIMAVFGLIIMVSDLIIMASSARYSGVGAAAGFLLMVSGMFPTQMLFSLNVTGLVLSAPVQKKLQTKIPVLCNFVCMAALFTFITLFKAVMIAIYPETLQAVCNELTLIALLGAVVTGYMAIAYKKFWLGTILFLVFYGLFTNGLFTISDDKILNMGIFGPGVGSFLLAWVLGIAILAAAAVVGYGVSLLLYKQPISKMSQPATLRKYL